MPSRALSNGHNNPSPLLGAQNLHPTPPINTPLLHIRPPGHLQQPPSSTPLSRANTISTSTLPLRLKAPCLTTSGAGAGSLSDTGLRRSRLYASPLHTGTQCGPPMMR
ncbi:hypothetical protein EJ05DRAFT_474726 [Pseudovirgaria hyperparasitica]|uniref:Uncharacterized protein n=1 Tax=Pseudovirgaria hyperparasitica TaxID=470096 RepID=A0A6A6WCS1_9PEZI|nr:uncharacterized protein EJ05DRAFT_474726 [Pseudovirgaria hyperparasitica]KAF2759646.1 hypothetical protein EJ05DRAFT_474726 [Pseudovirgaria hyperparasitica]